MYANVNKSNTGKLLVAVLAMTMIIAGVSIVFSDSVSAVESKNLNQIISDDEDGVISLEAGEYTLSGEIEKKVVITGVGNETIITIDNSSGAVTFKQNATFNDVTLKTNTASKMGITNTSNVGIVMTYNNVNFEFAENSTVYTQSGTTSTFNGCTFDGVKLAYSDTHAGGNAPSIQMISCTGSPNLDIASVDEVIIGDNITLTGSTFGAIEMYSNTTISIPQGETLTAESIAPADSQTNVKISVLGTLNGNIEKMPENSITSSPDAIINGQKGTWDVGYIGGDFSSNVDGASNQRIIVDRDLTLKGSQYVKIQGELIIEEGVTLTITQNAFVEVSGNANVYIYGDVVVDETFTGTSPAFSFNSTGTLTIDGTMTLDAANAFDVDGKTVINGSFTVSENASAVFAQTTVSADGIVEIYGEAKGKITNNGSISIDSTDLGTTGSDLLSIQMGVDGSVDIVNLVGWVEISDSELTFNYQNDSKDMKNDNVLKIASVRGVSVSESVTYSNDKTEGRIGTNVMVVTGSMMPGDDGTTSKLTGTFGIAADSYVTLGEGTSFDGIAVNVNGNLDVPVDVMANTEGTTIAGTTGSITVTGSITTISPITTKTVNAAMYETEKTTDNPTAYYVYTTLEKALASGAEEITVTGKITVKENIEIPVGTTVGASGATIVVDEDVTVDVLAEDKKSGVINGGTIDVNGTLTFQNNSKGNKAESIISDTSKESDPSMTYTNIYSALENAAGGETVEITSTVTVTIDRDVEVKAGVTLSVPSGKTVVVDYGATVTVNGTANIVGSYSMNTEDDTKTDGKTIVNGMFLYSNGVDYTKQIAGAYFMYNGVNAISTLENTASIINDVQSNNVTIYGENTAGDIAFDYTGDFMTLVVNTDAVLSAGTLDMGSVGFQADGCFTGTLEFTNGSVVLNEVEGISASDAVSYDGDAQIYTATVSGDAAYGGTIADGKGSVSFVGAVSSEADYAANVPVSVPTGSTLTVTAGTIADVSVEGTVEVTGAPIFNKAVVLGTLNVALGKSVYVATLYAGVSIVDGAVSDNTAAVVSEGVSITGTAYVGPNADIADKVLTGISKITEYYVDDVVYVTAYDKSDSVLINAITVDSPDAKFVQWNKADGTAVSNADKIGSPDKVYAELDYNICPVEVLDIPGVSVYIDGKEFNQSNFPNGMVSVGEHTIDVYVTPGWTGEPVITVNGQTVTDGKFTASADQTTTIQITGVTAGQATTSGGDDGLGLTDYLLIILVVLIVIMAIMVAMRLMRS